MEGTAPCTDGVAGGRCELSVVLVNAGGSSTVPVWRYSVGVYALVVTRMHSPRQPFVRDSLATFDDATAVDDDGCRHRVELVV